MKNTLVLLVVLMLISCSSEPKPETKQVVNEIAYARKSNDWISKRVKNAEKSMSSTPGGMLLWQSIQAHGGLARWFENGPISFRFDYEPVSGIGAKKTTQQVDSWSNRAVHQSVDNPKNMFGWDGENAWSQRVDTLLFSFDVRFWALTPYYFVGQPFIFDGEGVKIDKIADEELDGEIYDAIKISFEQGTGDAPDDYYINLYEKDTHILKALKYIVSHPKRFKKGEHSPEKIMLITSYQEIKGVKLAKTYQTYTTNEEGEKDKLVTNVTVSDVAFLSDLEDAYFEMPTGDNVKKF